MRWSSGISASRVLAGLCLCALAVVSTLLLFGVPEEKKITVYSNAANYSLPVVERDGQDYVGLLEMLEPLGTVSARVDGSRWKLRYNGVDGEFNPGKTRARVGGKNFELPANFILDGTRGLVPLSSLNALIPRFLGGPVTFHESARRLFIGSVAVHFTAQVRKGNPPTLVMEFTSPVNPSVATEPGKLRMTFRHEPLVPPGSQTLTFDDKTIPSATYQEGNGAAELTVVGTAPLTASFSNEGKTITISPVAQVPAISSLPPQTQLGGQNAPQVPSAPVVAPPRYFAVVDASHGGEERGAALSDKLAEKDVTLAFARRLRQELDARGMPTLVLRDGDVTLTADQRADLANSSHPAIYICFHAASLGNGVRLYTALIPGGNQDIGSFLDFDTAQSGFRPGSETVMTAIADELQKRQIPARTLSAGLRPLNNIIAPAVAVEVAPRSSVSDLASPEYQAAVSSAVASAIASVKDKLEVRR